jgi:hypothetical protein
MPTSSSRVAAAQQGRLTLLLLLLLHKLSSLPCVMLQQQVELLQVGP